jgi:uncharacterized repeat protein (TIGR01451 family)
MNRNNKIIILLGALMILASLAWMVQPYYTWAQEQNDNHPCRVALEYEDEDESLFRLENMNPGDVTTKTVTVIKTGSSSANLYMTWDFISGDPTKGLDGSLFEQLILVIKHKGEELYRGPMSNGPQAGSPSQLSDALFIAFMEHGDELELEFSVILPGPETGNEFQGSTLVTKIVFYTICSEEEDRTPRINIEKYTNGVDADVPTGPFIPVGGNVTWTYVVTNPGRVPLSNVRVTDNIPGVNPVYVSGDTNSNGLLDVGESWLFSANGIAVAGQYANIGTVVGTPPEGANVTDSDPSHYYGTTPDQTVINIEKYTNGVDADLPTGPRIAVGGNVTWTYVVTNPNTIPLYNIVVTDNRTGVTPVYVSGDLNGDNVLQPNEVWTYRATGIAVAGQYSNIGTVRGESAGGKVVTDTDPSHYFGFITPPPPPPPPGDEIVIDPDDPQVEPDPEEVIVEPEGPRQSPPLPRTDGVSIGLLITGMLIMFAGASLKLGNREKEQS